MAGPVVWLAGIWPKEADGTDINSVDRSHSGKFYATADDFGKVKVFNAPCIDKVGRHVCCAEELLLSLQYRRGVQAAGRGGVRRWGCKKCVLRPTTRIGAPRCCCAPP